MLGKVITTGTVVYTALFQTQKVRPKESRFPRLSKHANAVSNHADMQSTFSGIIIKQQQE